MSRHLTEDELKRLAEADQARSWPQMAMHRLQHHTQPSFDYAFKQMTRRGKPGLFFMKVGGTGMGCAMMADGVYHIIGGLDEETEDLFLPTPLKNNPTRIFTGMCEVSFGALLAYLGATKGPLR